MAYLGDATITIPSQDLRDIVLSAIGVNPVQSPAQNIANISQATTGASSTWLVWGAVGLAAFFLLRK